MCIIIIAPPGKDVDQETINLGIERNSHGWGVLGRDENDGNIALAYGQSKETAWRRWKALKGKHRVFHARIASSGVVDNENLHPFPCPAPNGEIRYLFHNGTLRSIPMLAEGRSDTWHLAKFLRNFDTTPELLAKLAKYATENASRFVLVLEREIASKEGEEPAAVWTFGRGWIKTPDNIFHSNGSALAAEVKRRDWCGGKLEVPGTRTDVFLPGFEKQGDIYVVTAESVAREKKFGDSSQWGEGYYGEGFGPYYGSRARTEVWDPVSRSYKPRISIITPKPSDETGSKTTTEAGSPPTTGSTPIKLIDDAERHAKEEPISEAGRLRGIHPRREGPGGCGPRAHRWADSELHWFEDRQGPQGLVHVSVDGPYNGLELAFGTTVRNGWCAVYDKGQRKLGHVRVSALQKLLLLDLGNASSSDDKGASGHPAVVASTGKVLQLTTSAERALAEWDKAIAQEVTERQGDIYTCRPSVRDHDPDDISDEEFVSFCQAKGMSFEDMARAWDLREEGKIESYGG